MDDTGEVQELIDLNSDINLDLFHQNHYAHAFKDILEESNLNCLFESENSFKLCFQDSHNIIGLSINIASLNSKFTALKSLIDSLNSANIRIGFISIQEVWNVDLNLFLIDGFKLVGKTRSNSRGGGCAIYINSEFSFEILFPDQFFIENILESICVKISISKKSSIILVNSYRPPHIHREQIEQFYDLFTEQIQKISELQLPIVFNGDYNIDLLSSNNNSSQLLDILSFFGMIQLTSKATRLHNNSRSLLDLVFTNIPNIISKTGIIIDSPSDHFITYFTVKSNKTLCLPTYESKRDFSNENELKFINLISQLNWNFITELDCVNLACNEFMDTLKTIYSLCFPVKIFYSKPRKNLNSFFTKGLLISRKHCLKLHRKSRTRPTPQNKDLYSRYRNIFNSLVRRRKKMYYNEKIKEAGKDSKKLWEILKESMNMPPSDNKIPSLNIDGRVVDSNTEIANNFNLYFTSLGNKAKSLIPNSTHNFREYLPPPNRHCFFMAPISIHYMFKYILSIQPKSSRDNNGFSMKLIHKIAASICIPLTHIFNLSCAQGTFPSAFKTSKTVPIFKKGNKQEICNYRGISLIDSFSKIFEKIIATRLSIFLENHSFFYLKQFGFRQKYSTQHALIYLTNFVTNALNNGKIALLLSFDVFRCFDIINHKILLLKLEHYGIRGLALAWFKSYFRNRKQKVFINGKFSENICQIEDGVLQGSILGVLLFIIFINDIPNCSELLDIILYADDNNSLLADENLERLISKANLEIDKLKDWYSSNKLAINPIKSNYMLFYPRWLNLNLPSHYDFPYVPLFLNLNEPGESDITKVHLIRGIPNNNNDSLRILGVLFDKNLNMKCHIQYIQGNISKAIYSIKMMKHLLDKKHLKLLYNSYIHSNILYASLFLSLCTDSTLDPLIKLQKKAIRAISNAKYSAHTGPLFKSLDILPVKLEAKYQSILFVHSFKFHKLPPAFDETWVQNNQLNPYVLRNGSDYNIPNIRYIYLFSHPLFIFPRNWNNLNNDMKNIEDLSTFKNALRKQLLDEIPI